MLKDKSLPFVITETGHIQYPGGSPQAASPEVLLIALLINKVDLLVAEIKQNSAEKIPAQPISVQAEDYMTPLSETKKKNV